MKEVRREGVVERMRGGMRMEITFFGLKFALYLYLLDIGLIIACWGSIVKEASKGEFNKIMLRKD